MSASADPHQTPPLTLVAAMSRNRVIGRDNQLPWRCPADLRRFKQLTTGGAIIMGRKTWDSIGRPLPNRLNIVLSRDTGLEIEGASVVSDLDAAVALAKEHGCERIAIIGGEQIYRLAIDRADAIELTVIETDIPAGDAHFPRIPEDRYTLAHREDHPADANNPHPYAFLTYHRREG